MKTNTLFAIGALVAASIATPIDSAAAATAPDASARIGADDYSILTFALTLEHLETAFYASALKKFQKSDFKDEALYNNVVRLATDEATHVSKISSVFKAAKRAVPGPCRYNFPFNTTAEFLKLASVIEGVGVSAYAGAAVYVSNKDVLKTAASILPIEARHDAILRLAVNVPPYAGPFDVPLTFQQVWSLASQFIVKGSCPRAVASLGLTAFPKLNLVLNATQTTVGANSTITLQADASVFASAKIRGIKHKKHETLHGRREQSTRTRALYVAFLTVDGPKTVEAQVSSGIITVKVPAGVSGQTYVVLTTSKTGVTDKTTLAGPAIIEISDTVAISKTGGIDDTGKISPLPVNRTEVKGGASVSASSGGIGLNSEIST